MTRLAHRAPGRTDSGWIWLAFVPILALAGCGGLAVTQILDTTRGGGRGSEWHYFARDGRLPLDVLGNPSAEPKERFAAAVAETLARAAVGPKVAFDAAAGAAARDRDRVTVLFGNEGSGFGVMPCALAEPDAQAVSRNPIVVYIAQCSGSETLRNVRGTIGVGEGGFERALDTLLAQALSDLTGSRGRGDGGNDSGGGM